MQKKIIQYLFKNPEEIGFDNHLVLVLCFLTAVLGLLGTLINIILHLGWITILSTLLPTFILTPVYLNSLKNGKYLVSKYTLSILSLILLNFQWIINFGSTGPILYLFVVLQSFFIIFFKNRERLIFTIAIFANVTVLFILEFYYPAIFGTYASNSVRLIDLYSGMLIYLFINIILLNVAFKFYNTQKEKAQLSDRLKSAFLANMSHEIRTPMNGILGFSELLKSPDLTGDQQQQYISIIEKSGKRMLNIINDIVDISKIESGLVNVTVSDTSITELYSFIFKFFKPEAENKNIQLICKNDITAKDFSIQTDKEKVYAVLTNLVKNAIKYTLTGTIELGYRVTAESETPEIEFYVKDTGIGIAPNRQHEIFERFIQADIADKMALQGAGLGLSISKAYVEMLGGKIWVESEEGKGSAFYFTLPFNPATALKRNDEQTSVYENISDTDKKLKILIVEDDDTSEMLISITVGQLSRELMKSRTGAEAIEICRQNSDIDLVLMDIKMPGMNGYEATRQIREFNKDVVIIAQTAYGLTGESEKAMQAGCNSYLAKPISAIELLALIQKHFFK